MKNKDLEKEHRKTLRALEVEVMNMHFLKEHILDYEISGGKYIDHDFLVNFMSFLKERDQEINKEMAWLSTELCDYKRGYDFKSKSLKELMW